MAKIVTAQSVASAIEEAKKRTVEIDEMQRKYDELRAAIDVESVVKHVDELNGVINDIDADLAIFARRKIKALSDMSDYTSALNVMGERSEVTGIVRKPIPGRTPRSEDVVTGKIYANAATACSVERIKYDFTTLSPDEAWFRAKGYPLRDVR